MILWLNFDKNFDFWQKFRFLTEISIFDKYFDFLTKIFFIDIYHDIMFLFTVFMVQQIFLIFFGMVAPKL